MKFQIKKSVFSWLPKLLKPYGAVYQSSGEPGVKLEVYPYLFTWFGVGLQIAKYTRRKFRFVRNVPDAEVVAYVRTPGKIIIFDPEDFSAGEYCLIPENPFNR